MKYKKYQFVIYKKKICKIIGIKNNYLKILGITNRKIRKVHANEVEPYLDTVISLYSNEVTYRIDSLRRKVDFLVDFDNLKNEVDRHLKLYCRDFEINREYLISSPNELIIKVKDVKSPVNYIIENFLSYAENDDKFKDSISIGELRSEVYKRDIIKDLLEYISLSIKTDLMKKDQTYYRNLFKRRNKK